jgi:hypothetical protein
MRRSTLTLTSSAFFFGSTVLAIAISACGGSDPQPAAAPSATYQYPPPQGQYPQQQPYPQQQYPQQQPYPQQTAYPQPTATAPAPAASGTMAPPGPLALPCQNDGACGLHRCNVPAGKCAFPCQTAVDCANGNQCMMGVCAPKPPGSP